VNLRKDKGRDAGGGAVGNIPRPWSANLGFGGSVRFLKGRQNPLVVVKTWSPGQKGAPWITTIDPSPLTAKAWLAPVPDPNPRADGLDPAGLRRHHATPATGLVEDGATQTMSTCAVNQNVSQSWNADGAGGIDNGGMPTMNDCTVDGNDGGPGNLAGGIVNNGTLNLIRTSVSSNTTDLGGPGIESAGSLALNHCSIANNANGGVDSGGLPMVQR
jgi:hypothetical protein